MRPSIQQVKDQYPHRYTMDHIPAWARKPCEGNGKYYAPQYRSDAEWYESTIFPGEVDWLPKKEKHCHSSKETWPLGRWLAAPLKG